MKDLEKAKQKKDKAQQDLEEAIALAVKEIYRLRGIIVYEPTELKYRRGNN